MHFTSVCVFVLISCVAVLSAPQNAPDPIVAKAAAIAQNQAAKLTRSSNDNSGDDGYQFTYELDNGQIHSEAGKLKEVNETKVMVVKGAYSFVADDGKTYWVNYTADENGYHPVIGIGTDGDGIKPGQDITNDL